MGTKNETGARSLVHEEGKGALVGKQREWGEPAVATKYERKQEGTRPPEVAGIWAFRRTREKGEEALPRQYMEAAGGGASVGMPKIDGRAGPGGWQLGPTWGVHGQTAAGYGQWVGGLGPNTAPRTQGGWAGSPSAQEKWDVAGASVDWYTAQGGSRGWPGGVQGIVPAGSVASGQSLRTWQRRCGPP